MTIDEYLNQLRSIRSAREKAYQNVEKKFNIATGSASSLQALRCIKTSENRQEAKLIDYADAMKEYNDLNKQYSEVKDQLSEAIDNLLYWEGCLIHRIYIYNVIFDDRDPFDGVDDILHTNSMNVRKVKLKQAKHHLRENLIEQGIEIE